MVDELYDRAPCWGQPPGVRRCAVRRKERCMQLAVFDDDRLAVVDGDVLIDVTDALGATGPDGPLRPSSAPVAAWPSWPRSTSPGCPAGDRESTRLDSRHVARL